MSSEIETSFTVDWISATFDPEQYTNLMFGLHDGMSLSRVKAVPTRGYTQAIELESGLRLNWHEANEGQGMHMVASGSCLRWYYAHGKDWRELFAVIDSCGGRTSRVDLAFDVKNTKLSPVDLCKPNLRAYKGKGRTPKFNALLGGDGSWTLYIGSRSSEKMLRIYDKAKEQGDYASDYIRIELETKGEVARAVGWNFAREATASCMGMALGLVKGVADFDLAAWDRSLSGNVVGFSLPQGKARDTFGWLVKVCAPALAKEIEKHPKEGVLDAFWGALKAELGARGITVSDEA